MPARLETEEKARGLRHRSSRSDTLPSTERSRRRCSIFTSRSPLRHAILRVNLAWPVKREHPQNPALEALHTTHCICSPHRMPVCLACVRYGTTVQSMKRHRRGRVEDDERRSP